eukprot:SAG25_NODE_367_length_9118_cov_54.828578_5_plen_178_part_00
MVSVPGQGCTDWFSLRAKRTVLRMCPGTAQPRREAAAGSAVQRWACHHRSDATLLPIPLGLALTGAHTAPSSGGASILVSGVRWLHQCCCCGGCRGGAIGSDPMGGGGAAVVQSSRPLPHTDGAPAGSALSTSPLHLRRGHRCLLITAASYHGRARRRHGSYCCSRSTTAVVATSCY